MDIILDPKKRTAVLDASALKTASAPIKVSLRWQNNVGFVKRVLGRRGIDLDLGCYYELRDGSRLLIDSLQFAGGLGGDKDKPTRQGCYTMPPYIWHSGDASGRSRESEEAIYINPAELSEIKRVQLYVYIYEGDTYWSDVKASIVISVPGQDDHVIDLDMPATDKRFCLVAELDFSVDGKIEVTELMTMHRGHADCDRNVGWGFEYRK